ncbi:MAG: hypothetical protein HRU69_13195 [Flammeovirgaceae bacterium]|nr:MAG: hypothetical protein HRU69_13195 [Flammeovirgaceae bacterium]
MKKQLTILFICITGLAGYAQEFGLSFSYFIPKNGYFSAPISPFSLRGVGVDLNRFIAIETGASLYRMSGLGMKGLPFKTKQPLVGPNFTVFIPVELVLMLKGTTLEFDVKAGGFGFYGLGQKINYGNLDRALRETEGWDVANAQVQFDNTPGFGYHVGAEVTVYVTNEIGVSLETNYLVGESRFPLSGTYTGGNTTLETKPIEYADARIDFTGLEFSIGVFYNTANAPARKKKRK